MRIAAPTAIDAVCGVPMSVSAAEYTRPWSSGGVRSWTAVPKPTTAKDSPAPAMPIPTRTTPDGGDQEERVAGAEEQDAERHRPGVADAADHRRRGDGSGDRADALPGAQHAQECGRLVDALLEHGEDRRLGEPDHEQRRRDREHDPAQARPVGDVRDPGDELGQDVVLGRDRPRLAQAERPQAHGRGEERRGVERRDRRSADGCEEPCADERGDQPRALARGLEHRVRVGEAILGQHLGQKRRLGRREQVPGGAVHERDERR